MDMFQYTFWDHRSHCTKESHHLKVPKTKLISGDDRSFSKYVVDGTVSPVQSETSANHSLKLDCANTTVRQPFVSTCE